MTDFSALMAELKQRCDAQLRERLPQHISGSEHSQFSSSQALCQAMRYSSLDAGKRIRPILLYATGLALHAPLEHCDLAACAVECVHTGSLIHDDLPAMDNDDLRRGKPSNHIQFDEATAILAGISLQTIAYEFLSAQADFLPADNIVEMTTVLARAFGSQGVCGGQHLDMQATAQAIKLDDLSLIHHLKTGALITASIKLGILASQCQDQTLIDNLITYAQAIGLGFQVVDDILDIESSSEVLGKPSGSDQTKHKATYPSIISLKEAKKIAKNCQEQAINALADYNQDFDFLRFIASYIIDRIH